MGLILATMAGLAGKAFSQGCPPHPNPCNPILPWTSAAGSTFYVDFDSGSNCTGDGSSTNPWKTITWALAQVQPPQVAMPATVAVRARAGGQAYAQNPVPLCDPASYGAVDERGEYFPLVIRPGITLTSDPPLPPPGFLPILDGADVISCVDGVTRIDVKEIVLLGRTSSGYPSCPLTPQSLGDYFDTTVVENLEIRNSDGLAANPDDTKGHGILMLPMSPATQFSPVVRNCTIEAVEGHGILVKGATGITLSPRIEGCTILDPAGEAAGGGFLAHHILIQGNGSSGSPRVLSNTLKIVNPNVAGGGCKQPQLGAAIGIDVDGAGVTMSPVVEGNFIQGLRTLLSCPNLPSIETGLREGIYLCAHDSGSIQGARIQSNTIRTVVNVGITLMAWDSGHIGATIGGTPGSVDIEDVGSLKTSGNGGCDCWADFKRACHQSTQYGTRALLAPAVFAGIALLAGGQTYGQGIPACPDDPQNLWWGPGTIEVAIGGDLWIRNNRGFGIFARSDHDRTGTLPGTSHITGTIWGATIDNPGPWSFTPIGCQEPPFDGTFCFVPAAIGLQAMTAGKDSIDLTIADVIGAQWCRGLDVDIGQVDLVVTNCTWASSQMEGIRNDGTGLVQVYNNVLWDNQLGGSATDPDFCGIVASSTFAKNTVECFPGADGCSPADCGPAAGGYGEFGNSQKMPALDATFHLGVGTQAIESGDDAAPGLPATDIDGDPRKIELDSDPETPLVDLGADEKTSLP